MQLYATNLEASKGEVDRIHDEGCCGPGDLENVGFGVTSWKIDREVCTIDVYRRAKAGFMMVNPCCHGPMTKLFFPMRQDSEPPMSSTGAKAEEPEASRPTNAHQHLSSLGANLEHVLSRCL